MLPSNRSWRHYIGITTNFLLGAGLALLSVMVVTINADLFGESPWTLPLLVFVLLIALLLNHVPRSGRRREKVETVKERTV